MGHGRRFLSALAGVRLEVLCAAGLAASDVCQRTRSEHIIGYAGWMCKLGFQSSTAEPIGLRR